MNLNDDSLHCKKLGGHEFRRLALVFRLLLAWYQVDRPRSSREPLFGHLGRAPSEANQAARVARSG